MIESESTTRKTGAGALVALLLLVTVGCASAPPFEGFTGEQIFEVGVEAYEEEDWDDAARAFERLVSGHPGFARIAEVRFFLANTYFEKGEYLSAVDEYERFLQRHPSHGLAPEASLGICRSYVRLAPHPQRDQRYTERARDACRLTRDEFQGINVAEEAEQLRQEMVDRLAMRRYQEGRFYQRRNFHDSAIMIFREVVDYFPETDWAPRAFLALYRSYQAIGWEEEAEEVRDRLLFLHPDSDAARELYAEEDGP
jgi:outer membrane protein assembly factor BamD